MAGIWMVCAVCGYPLEHAPKGSRVFGGAEWGHIVSTAQDHVPVPVEPSEIEFRQRCDFCYQENATDVILADSFVIPIGGSKSIGHWAACEQCAELVRRRRWSELVTRVKRFGPPASRNAPRSVLTEVYQALALHMHGQVTLAEWRARADYSVPVEDD